MCVWRVHACVCTSAHVSGSECDICWCLQMRKYVNNRQHWLHWRFADSRAGKKVEILSLLIMTSPSVPWLHSCLWMEVLLGSQQGSHSPQSLSSSWAWWTGARSPQRSGSHHTALWQACLAHEVKISSLSPAAESAFLQHAACSMPIPALGFLLWSPKRNLSFQGPVQEKVSPGGWG